MKKTAVLFFLFSSMLIPLGIAGEEKPVTLPLSLSFKEALRMAKERHVEIIIADERVRQAVARLGQAASALLPQINATASQSRKTINLKSVGIEFPTPPALPGQPTPSSPNPVIGPFDSFDARLSVTQSLFDAAAIQRLRSAVAGKRLSRAAWRKAEEDTLALVAHFYIEAQRAKETAALARTILKLNDERYRIAKIKLNHGHGSEVEYERAQADLAESKFSLQQAETAELEKRLDLTAALGIPDDRQIEFVEDAPAYDLPKQKKDLSAHPDIEVAKETIKQSKSDYWAAVAEYLPKMSGFADYGASGSVPSDSKQTYTYGAKISFPLFEGGRNFFRMRESKSLIRENEARLKDKEYQVKARAVLALQTIKQAEAFLESKKEQFIVSSKQLNLARIRNRTGFGSRVEVLEAMTEAATAKDAESEAFATFRLAKVNLAHAFGDVEQLIGKD